jgi:hypothetical protein
MFMVQLKAKTWVLPTVIFNVQDKAKIWIILLSSTSSKRINVQSFQLVMWFILNLKKIRVRVSEQFNDYRSSSV